MGTTVRILGLALCLLFAAQPAIAAGDDPLEPPDLSEYLRWGFLRVRPGLAVSNFGHDDNVFYNASDTRGDITLTVTPALDGLILLGSRGFVTFSENIDYTLYKKFNELNTLDHTGRYRLTLPFRNAGLFVETELARLHERPIDLQDARTIRRSAAVAVGAIMRLGWRTTVELAHARTEFNHTDEDFGSTDRTIGDVKDRTENKWTARGAYVLVGRSRLTLEIADRSLEFDNPFLGSLPGVVRNLDQRTFLPGVDFGIGGALSGTIHYGYTRLDYDDPALTDYRGIVGRTALTYHMKGSSRITLDAERRVDFSVWENNSYLLDNRRSLRVTRFLNRYFGLEGLYSKGTVEIPEPVQGLPRRDRVREYSLGVVARIFENELGRKIEYALRLRDRDQISSVTGFDQSRRTITLSADVGF